MKKKQADNLCQVAEEYIGSTIELHKQFSGKTEKREFLFKEVFNFYFETVVRTEGEYHDPENRYYEPKAILEEKNGREKIDASLEKVLDAIKNDKIIYYNKF